jgi:hypothetical protein
MVSKTRKIQTKQDEVAEKRRLYRLIAAKHVAEQRIEFATKHHRDTRGRPLSFQYRPYLKLPYADPSPVITMRVPVQIGKTEWQVCDSLACASLAMSVFNVQPKFELRGVHVAERFDRLIAGSPYYLEQVKHRHGARDSTTLKHFGPGSLRFVGSRVESDMISFPADVLEIDELDRCDLSILVLAEDRLQESDYKLIRRTSTPTIQGSAALRNIDFFFQISDQKRWYVPCPECGYEQEIRWDTHLVDIRRDDEGRIIALDLKDRDWTEGAWRRRERRIKLPCAECGGTLDRLAEGRWIPTRPEIQEHSGYTMSRLIAVTTEVEHLWLELEKSVGNPAAMQRVVNSFFGEPYTGIGDRFSQDLLDDAVTVLTPFIAPLEPEALAEGGCTMGVDVNRPYFDVRISDYPYERQDQPVRRLVYAGKVRTEAELIELVKKYRVKTCCVDSEPEARWSLHFQRTAPCAVWRVQYRHGSEGLIVKDMNVDYKLGLITVDRTMALDELLSRYARRCVAVPRNYSSLCNGDFTKEMTSAVRVLDSDGSLERYVWNSEGCHALHTDNYDYIAEKVGGHVPRELAERSFSRNMIRSNRSPYSEVLDEITSLNEPASGFGRSRLGEGIQSYPQSTARSTMDGRF